jgi:RNA polymerase sigma-70 factor (ECF subfamily)
MSPLAAAEQPPPAEPVAPRAAAVASRAPEGLQAPPVFEVRAPAEAAATVERLYRKHQGFVFRLALRYGRGRKAWADDVTQDVFVDLLTALPGLRDVDAIEGWLYRVTTHRCLKRVRRERFLSLAPVRWLLGMSDEEPVHAEVAAVARHDLQRAFAALHTLPPKERVAFSMFHLDGKSQDEIGEVLGHKKSYVCKLIQRATEQLRKLGWEVPDAAP